jgi:hypothetical protein
MSELRTASPYWTPGATHPRRRATLLVLCLSLVAFVVHELHSDHPMLDVRVFTNRAFSGASGAVAVLARRLGVRIVVPSGPALMGVGLGSSACCSPRRLTSTWRVP